MFGMPWTDRGVATVTPGPRTTRGYMPVGWIHTHPNPGDGFIVDRFSAAEAAVSRWHGVPGYLDSPGGTLRRLRADWSGNINRAVEHTSPYTRVFIPNIFGID